MAKPKDHTHFKSKSLSSFAAIITLFIYISIFYVFNLSPYDLVNNNMFWFFMSNTLLLIIAADYGAFSSSPNKQKQQDLHEEYVKHSQARSYTYVSSSSFVPKYEPLVDKHCINNSKQGEQGGDELLQENNKESIITQSSEIPERVLEIVAAVAQNEPKKSRESFNNEKKLVLDPLQVGDGNYNKEWEEKAIIQGRIYRRSKSDREHRTKRVVIDEGMKRVRRLESMKVEVPKEEEEEEEEENEFSKMTNEDLNRRVEEFIQKFNRQIRLQAVTRN